MRPKGSGKRTGRARRLLAAALILALALDLALLLVLTFLPAGSGLPPELDDQTGGGVLPPDSPVQVGEKCVYELSLGDVPCGHIRMSIAVEEAQGRPRIVVHYDGATTQAVELLLSYDIAGKTWVDPSTMLPLRAERVTRKKKKIKHHAITFDRSAGTAQVLMKRLDKEKRREYHVPFTMGLDGPSAILYARTLDLSGTGVQKIDFVDGHYLVELEMKPVGAEIVTVKAGAFKARVLDVVLTSHDAEEDEQEKEEPQRMRLWLAEDAPRRPVKLELGTILGPVRAELLSADEGGDGE